MNNIKHSSKKQTGVVLVVSLVMLLLLTLIGLTGTQVTSLEEKMAGNMRDQNIAFQAAEATLIQAENFIMLGTTNVATFNGNGGLLGGGSVEPDYFVAATWGGQNSAVTTAGFGNNFNNIADPRYVIKRMGPVVGSSPPQVIYKITARAQGVNAGTQVVLQEYYSRIN